MYLVCCLEGFQDVKVNYVANETRSLEEVLASNPDVTFYHNLLADFKNQQARTKVRGIQYHNYN